MNGLRGAFKRIPCMYCGNTGTVGGAPCPVCRPGRAAPDGPPRQDVSTGLSPPPGAAPAASRPPSAGSTRHAGT